METLDRFKLCIFEHFQLIHAQKVLKNCLKAKKGQLNYGVDSLLTTFQIETIEGAHDWSFLTSGGLFVFCEQ